MREARSLGGLSRHNPPRNSSATRRAPKYDFDIQATK
jgi:hypothetical protein